LGSPGFKTISKLIDKGKTWIKLSGAYQHSKVGPPSYSTRFWLLGLTLKLRHSGRFGRATGRILLRRKPDDAVLFDLLAVADPLLRSYLSNALERLLKNHVPSALNLWLPRHGTEILRPLT
jgi:hypothetical protein